MVFELQANHELGLAKQKRMWALVIPGLHTELHLVTIRDFVAFGSWRLRAPVKVFPPKEQGKEDQKHQYVHKETLTCKKANTEYIEPVPIQPHLHVNKFRWNGLQQYHQMVGSLQKKRQGLQLLRRLCKHVKYQNLWQLVGQNILCNYAKKSQLGMSKGKIVDFNVK